MTKRLLIILVSSLIATVGCAGDEESGETMASAGETYQEIRAQRSVMDSPQERDALTREFLVRYPESSETAAAVNAIVYYGTEIGDLAGAVAYAEEIRSKLTNTHIATAVDREMIAMYAKSGDAAKMAEIANRLGDEGVLDFDDHWNVIEGGVNAGEWQLARDYCAKARAMATPEILRAENPDPNLTDEALAEAVNDRTGMLMVKDGWAQANLGDAEAALAVFAAADKLIPRYYFDIPEYDLNVYWSRTLLMKGEFQGAIDRAARSGLVMRNEDALAVLKEAYVGMRGNKDGYESYRDKLHRETATTIDEFEMPDYEGNKQRFADIRGDVTLLTLWFPT